VPFNPAQVSTWAEATYWAKIINGSAAFRQAGIFIIPQNPPHSGIYLPPWESGPHGDQEPQIGNAYWLHYRFSNGMEGMNAGPVRQKFLAYPTSPLYVVGELLKEVIAGARV
jgi:hypothetical protein